MTIRDLLTEHKDAIIHKWIDAMYGTYPFDTVGFLRSRAQNVDLDNHAEGKGALGYFMKSAWEVILGYLKPKKN